MGEGGDEIMEVEERMEGGVCFCDHLLPLQSTPCTKQVYTAVLSEACIVELASGKSVNLAAYSMTSYGGLQQCQWKHVWS